MEFIKYLPRICHKLPQVLPNLCPAVSLTYQQIKQRLCLDGHFVYEVLITIDESRLAHIPSISKIDKVRHVAQTLHEHSRCMRYYGVFEHPAGKPSNLHWHGLIAFKHKSYDGMIRKVFKLKNSLYRVLNRTVGRCTFARINSFTESYKPSEVHSSLALRRKVGNLEKYTKYMNKSIDPFHTEDIYQNTLLYAPVAT